MCMFFCVKLIDHIATDSRTFDLASALKLTEKFVAAQTSDFNHSITIFHQANENRHLNRSKGDGLGDEIYCRTTADCNYSTPASEQSEQTFIFP